MRPINRSDPPRVYAKYGDAIGDLEERLGTYCSYCERRLPVSLAVEHMCPKSLNPERELDWNNFLLGCTNCNSVKGDTAVDEDDYLWPDRDNTLLALNYNKGGFVELSSDLTHQQRTKAKALVDLVGLDRHGGTFKKRPAKRDKRWLQRDELWKTAERVRFLYESLDRSDEARRLVIIAAKAEGFFSIWMQFFDGYPEVKKELISAFNGTALSCFDDDFHPVNRAGGIV